MKRPYAHIQEDGEGKPWMFLEGEPVAPISRRAGEAICKRINRDIDSLYMALEITGRGVFVPSEESKETTNGGDR